MGIEILTRNLIIEVSNRTCSGESPARDVLNIDFKSLLMCINKTTLIKKGYAFTIKHVMYTPIDRRIFEGNIEIEINGEGTVLKLEPIPVNIWTPLSEPIVIRELRLFRVKTRCKLLVTMQGPND